VNDAGRLVRTLASEGLWRQVGRIGFDEDAISRDGCGNRPQIVRLFIRDHAGQADEEAQVEELGRLLSRAGEGMHDAGERAALTGFAKHRENLGGGLTKMNHQRQTRCL
jgi:hypothetical protein